MSKGIAPPSYGIASPCMDCGDRKVFCHDNCGRYNEYKDHINRIKDAEYADKVARSNRPTAPKKKSGSRSWSRK